MSKIITFYRKDSYGNKHEYVHPSHDVEKKILQSMTGKLTITPEIRDQITRLTDGQVTFEQVINP